MSANNQLIIQKWGTHYRISNIDIDVGGGFFIDNEKYKSKKKVFEAAEKYVKENEVEYGINHKIQKVN